MIRYLFFILSLLLFNTLSGATTIHGKDSGYIGQEIIFFIPADPITGTDSIIAETKVNSDGSFKLEIITSEILMIYAYPGIYKFYLFIEPGKDYEVILPPYKPKSDSDRLNPFFRPIEVQLATTQFIEDELNVQIRMFNDAYMPYYNKHISKIFTDNDFEVLDKDISQMEKPFSRSKNTYFNDYRNYKYGMLRFLAYQQKSKRISDDYFKGEPFLYNNPAYIDLFNMVYTRYFEFFSRADSSKNLARAISESKTYDSLYKVLLSDKVLRPDELLNMVMLKCIHEEFYDDNFSRTSLLTLLDSFIKTVKNPQQLSAARKIRWKVTKLLAGYIPPQFQLYDTDSNIVSLENFKGKFVYLNFCACFSYTCMNEFAILQRLYEKHNKYLEIVTIIVDEDVPAMKDFVDRRGYSWRFLHFDNQPFILQEYDIRVFPTYFLIDNEGKLAISPALPPSEEFEGRLFKELRSKGVL